MDSKTLRKFLVEAKTHGYASGGKGQVNPQTGQVEFLFSMGSLSYKDLFWGSVQFLGQETVHYQGQCQWGMNYWGESIDSGLSSFKSTEDSSPLVDDPLDEKVIGFSLPNFLKECLSHVTEDAPFRGPQEYRKIFSEYEVIYRCRWTGDISGFTGDEAISIRDRAVYRLFFHGGFVK